MKIATVIAIISGLYLIDRVCLWLEKKGWLYYRHQKKPGGFIGNALLGLNLFLDPSIRHTVKMKQSQVAFRRSEADDTGEPMTNDEGKKYDLIASGFAEMRDSFNTEQKYIDLLIDHLKPGANVLDVGCGSGFPIASVNGVTSRFSIRWQIFPQ